MTEDAMDPDAEAEAEAETEAWPGLLPAIFVVRGPRGETRLEDVTGLVVGEHGELIVTREDANCIAIFAPGAWSSAVREE